MQRVRSFDSRHSMPESSIQLCYRLTERLCHSVIGSSRRYSSTARGYESLMLWVAKHGTRQGQSVEEASVHVLAAYWHKGSGQHGDHLLCGISYLGQSVQVS